MLPPETTATIGPLPAFPVNAAAAGRAPAPSEMIRVFSAINRNQGYENVFVNGSFQVTRHVGLHVRVDNALNERYQEVLGYSALARTAIGGVSLKW